MKRPHDPTRRLKTFSEMEALQLIPATRAEIMEAMTSFDFNPPCFYPDMFKPYSDRECGHDSKYRYYLDEK